MRAAVENGSIDPFADSIGRAHVRVVVGDSGCSGTLISPSWVLTSAHCTFNSNGGRIDFLNAMGMAVRSVRANACYMHPVTLMRGGTAVTIDRCIDLRASEVGVVPVQNDIALLHLEEVITDVPARTIDPPRSCVLGPDRTMVPFRFRGYGGAVGRDPSGQWETVVEGIGGFNVYDVWVADTEMVTPFPRFVAGDSGGGFTRLDEDETGAVLAVAVGIPRFGSPTHATGAFLWGETNIVWLWSVLDGSGVCSLGAPRACVLREPAPPEGSTCGDMHCTGDETADDCSVDCALALPDSDGDGLPDMRDLCPSLDARTVPADRIVDGNHIDTDHDLIGDDCAVAACTALCLPDPDHDAIPTPCDNCPTAANGDQFDTDGDGLGDACDNCPFTANPDQATGGDSDIYPDACDNCPDVYNPDQANCNADAEIAFGVLAIDPTTAMSVGPYGVGDACDPVPCGDIAFGTGTRVVDRGGLTFRGIGTSTVRVDAIASEPFEGRTGLRMCRCSAASSDDIRLRQQCTLLQPDLTGLCAIADGDAYDFPTESPTWHLMSLSFGDVNGDGVIDLADARGEPVLTYDARTTGFETDLALDWDLDRDLDRWAVEFSDFFPIDGFGNRRPVPGIVWTRTPGPLDTDFPVDSAEAKLTHHYTSGLVTAPLEARAPFPSLDFIAPFLPVQALCPLCVGAFPSPWLAFPGGPAPFTPPSIAFRETYLDAAASFNTDVTTLFDGSGKWIAASEPVGWLPEGGLRYANVLDDGTVARVLIETPFGLSEPGSKMPPPIPCDNPNGCVGLFAATATRTETPTRVSVLSARREVLFTLEAGRLVIQDLRALTTRVANDPAHPLGDVLAATYDPANEVLIVLDEITRESHHRRHGLGRARGPRVGRLLRIDPTSGAVEIVTTFPRLGLMTRFALAPEPNGGLWLAASGERGPHVVVLLEGPWWELREHGFAIGAGGLASAQARADRRGLSLAIEDRRGSSIVGHAAEALVGRRGRNLGRCF